MRQEKAFEKSAASKVHINQEEIRFLDFAKILSGFKKTRKMIEELFRIEQLYDAYARTKKYLYFFLAICALGWGFTPYHPTFLGLFLGSSVSLFNFWLLVRRAHAFDKAIETSGKIHGIGTLSRMASSVAVMLIAVEFPQKVHLISVVIGLMTAYIVIMADYLLQHFILHKNGEKRGE